MYLCARPKNYTLSSTLKDFARVETDAAALSLLVRSAIFLARGNGESMNIDERRSYIKERCLTLGGFTGHKKEIYSHDGKWFISHTDQFGTSSEQYGENLDDAVADYVALEQAYGVDEA